MKKLFSLVLILGTTASFAAELNLYKILNPGQKNIDNISFPRNNQLLYRGLHPAQMDFKKAIRAMLGDKGANLESPLLYVVKEKLMGKSPALLSSLTHLILEYNTLGMENYISHTLSKYPNMDEEEAFEKAVEITTKAITDRYNTYAISQQYIDYTSSSRNDWPTSLIYSSIHIEVAKIYSKHIVVFEDGSNHKNYRSLDLNFWNKNSNNRWIGTNNEFPDKGEFLTPLYIPYKNIVGYQFNRLSDLNLWYLWEDLQNDLNISFYKARIKNKNYVLIVDGNMDNSTLTQTIVRENGTYYYGRSTFDPNATHPTYPVKADNKPVNIYGVIEVCDPNCGSDIKTVFPQYTLTKRKLNSSMLASINKIKIAGKNIKIHTLQTINQVDPADEYNKIVNLTPAKIVKYLSGKENSKKVQKINANCTSTNDSMTCSLGDYQLAPGKMIFIPVEAKFRDMNVHIASMEQRQEPSEQPDSDKTGWDKRPAYSSIQFYMPDKNQYDNWRFYGGKLRFNPPKGSLFAEVRDLSSNRTQSLDFFNNNHLGNITNSSSSDKINPYALRIMNVGKDNTYINTLTVSFK